MNTNPTTIPGDAGSIADDNSALGVDRARGSGPDADALGVLRHLPRAEPRDPEPDPAQAEATVNEVLAALGLAKAATLAVARARSHSPGALGAVASLRLAGSIGADPELAGLRDDLGDAALAHVDAILAGAPSVPTPAVAESTRLAAALDADEELGLARRRLLELQAGIAGLLGEAAPPLHDPGANAALLSSIGFKLRAAEALAAEARGDLDFAREGRDKAQAALRALGWDCSTDSGEWLAGRLDALPRDLALVAVAAVHELHNALVPLHLATDPARAARPGREIEGLADSAALGFAAATRGLAAADQLARVLTGAAPDGAPYAAGHLRGWAAGMEAEGDPAWDLEIAAARMLAAHVSGDRSARIPEALILAEADRIRRRDAADAALERAAR